MSLRNKLAGALAKCDGYCLDDDGDRRAVLDTLQTEIAGAGFASACEFLRWFVQSQEQSELRQKIQVLLRSVGEL